MPISENLAPDLIDRSIITFKKIILILTFEQVFFVILAVLPVFLWLYIFLKHQREKPLLVILSFVFGALSVVPIFVFQYEIIRIEDWLITLLPGVVFGIVISGFWVGLYEETVKHWIVKIVDRRLFRNIDDAIQFSIIVALGFSFLENSLYFQAIWDNPQVDNFWFYYIFRSIGSMLLHILASGIFGYYYGVAYFAKPVLQDEINAGHKFVFTKKMHQILHLKSTTLFREEKITEGLLIAVFLHGTFDFCMGMSQNAVNSNATIAIKVWLIAIVPILITSYFYLIFLLDKKENHKIYKQIDERDVLDDLNSELVLARSEPSS